MIKSTPYQDFLLDWTFRNLKKSHKFKKAKSKRKQILHAFGYFRLYKKFHKN